MNKMVNGKIVPLTAEEIAQREIDIANAQAEQARQDIVDQINTNKKYLADTDWYVTRMTETGIAIPTEVTTNRANARTQIDTLEAQLGA